METTRIDRLVRILTSLQAGKNYTAGDLAKMFGRSKRTIFRDLKQLQGIGVPFHYHARTGTYVIDPEFFLAPVDLNLQEALSLLLLVHKAGEQMELPFKKSALLAALKIETTLPVAVRDYCNFSLGHITAKVAAQAPADDLDRCFFELQTAIGKKRVVDIEYKSLFEGEIISLSLRPYHLFYNRRAWYVMGWSEMHESVRTFKLNRILRLKVTSHGFCDEDGFDLDEYLGRAWSMIPEGRIYDVKLRFLAKVAENVSEVRWHDTQKVSKNEDGSVKLEFRVDGLGEIFWWILGYGDQVEVLGPAELRQRLAETGRKMAEVNG